MKFNLSTLMIPPWVKIAITIAPWLLVAGLFGALHLTRVRLHEVRMNDKLLAAQSEVLSKTQELKWAQSLSSAQSGYLSTIQNLSSLKDKSDEDTKTFAATPAGAVDCLSLDRVRSALSHRSALEAALTASGGNGTVQSGSDPTPGPIGK